MAVLNIGRYNENLTKASRIMLPAYIIINLYWGFIFTTDPEERLTRAPGFAYVRSVMSLDQWGLVMLGLTAGMVLSILFDLWRRGTELALAFNAVTWAYLAYALQQSTGENVNSTYLAGSLPMFVAVASVASLVSLLWNETDRIG